MIILFSDTGVQVPALQPRTAIFCVNMTKGNVKYSRECKSYATQPFRVFLSPSVLSKRRVSMGLGKGGGLQARRVVMDVL